MTHYIDKDVVVSQANIEITNCRLAAQKGILTEFGKGKLEGLEGIVDFLNTLEAKAVDLEKELENLIEKEKAFVTDNREVKYYNGDSFNHIYELEFIAKHFFELGLSVNNPITAADRGTAEEIIINLKRVEQDYRIDLTKEMEWVRNQVKKGI